MQGGVGEGVRRVHQSHREGLVTVKPRRSVVGRDPITMEMMSSELGSSSASSGLR